MGYQTSSSWYCFSTSTAARPPFSSAMGHLRGRNPGGTILPRGTTRRERGSILQAPFDRGAAIVFLKDSCLHRRSDPAMKRLRRLPLLALPLLLFSTAAPADP